MKTENCGQLKIKPLVLLYCISLSILTVPVYASPDTNDACNTIVAACKDAGFKQGGTKDGVSLWHDCVQPILLKKPGTSSIHLPAVDANTAAACLKAHPSYGH